MKKRRRNSCSWMMGLGTAAVALLLAAPSVGQELVAPVSAMDSTEAVEFTKGAPRVVSDAPGGSKVLVCDQAFTGRIDISKLGIDPSDYDLIKVQVKADRAAVLSFDVENHPGAGDRSYWWVLDGLRGPFQWRTIWIDLKMVEEIKRRGDDRARWREGTEGGANVRHLSFNGQIKDTGRRAQGSDRRIWLGPIRFVKKSVDIDWDQSQAPYTWGQGEDLVYTYPLQVSNRLDRPITALVQLVPFDAKEAKASLSEERVELGPKEIKTIEAKVMLPAAAAAGKPPLYAERFEVLVEAEGIADSQVTILRSSDPIHLTVTVPIDERKLAFPIFPTPKELPASVVHFDAERARRLATGKPPAELIRGAMQYGIYEYGKDDGKAESAAYHQAITSSAFLYNLTGEQRYLQIAEQLLAALPDIWDKFYKEWQKEPVRVVGSGIVARWNNSHHYTLGLGWRVAGTQRSPYQYSRDHNAGGGGMSAIMYAFDMIANDLKPETRDRVIHGFLVPAGIQCRNHYVGDGNQQATADAVALYAGLVGRNYPLVSFAYSSEHGVESILDWAFTDEGVHIRDKYQTYALRPVFWITEMLAEVDVDLYSKHKQRFVQLVNQGYQDKEFWQYVQNKRMR